MIPAILAMTTLLAQAGSSEDVLQLQVLLDRAHFSPGEIDGREGSNTERATRAFQTSRRLQETALPDEETWTALGRDGTPALAQYALAEADVAGPFTQVPEDMMAKARLPRLDYSSPLEAVAERFHASPELLRGLNPGATFARAGEVLHVPNVHAAPPATKAGRVVVSADDLSVTAL